MSGIKVAALVIAALLVGYGLAPRTRELLLHDQAAIELREDQICLQGDVYRYGADDEWAVLALGPKGETFVFGISVDLSEPPATLPARARDAWKLARREITRQLAFLERDWLAAPPDPCDSTDVSEPCS